MLLNYITAVTCVQVLGGSSPGSWDLLPTTAGQAIASLNTSAAGDLLVTPDLSSTVFNTAQRIRGCGRYSGEFPWQADEDARPGWGCT